MEYGIVFDSADGTHGKSHHDMGTTVFATEADRQAALAWLKEMGYHYWMEFKDVQGYGLCWAWRYSLPLRWTAGGRAVRARKAAAARYG